MQRRCDYNKDLNIALLLFLLMFSIRLENRNRILFLVALHLLTFTIFLLTVAFLHPASLVLSLACQRRVRSNSWFSHLSVRCQHTMVVEWWLSSRIRRSASYLLYVQLQTVPLGRVRRSLEQTEYIEEALYQEVFGFFKIKIDVF